MTDRYKKMLLLRTLERIIRIYDFTEDSEGRAGG